MLTVLLAGSVSAPAEDRLPEAAANAAQRTTVALASEAASEGVRKAIESISASQALKLDVRLSGLTSLEGKAAPVAVAAN